MMTPKMKEDLCTQILNASRQLFLSSKISEVCQEKGTQKQLEFILELMQGFQHTKHLKDTVTSMSSFLLLIAGRSLNHWNLCLGRRTLYYTALLE